MGGHPYWYVVKYKPDVNEALQELREREFQAGRYNPVIEFLDFPIGPHSPAPGARHATMAEALEASEANGTRSIIDLERISETSELGTARRLGDDVLQELFGTTRPTRATVEAKYGLLSHLRSHGLLRRGQGFYIMLYKNNMPNEIYFAGYSYD
jgi:hypothetical protein